MLVGKPVYENAFNKIERDLRAEEGIANELDYVEQTSWVLFLKYLHDLETERADRAELDGSDYAPIIDGEYRWDKWAAPKKDGEFDHNAARIGDDLIKFADGDLFPYLAAFRHSATSPQTIQYKIGEVFTELRNKFRSGYILRDVLGRCVQVEQYPRCIIQIVCHILSNDGSVLAATASPTSSSFS